MLDIASPVTVRRLMKSHNFRYRKSLGQNFLVDANIVSKIVQSAEVNKQDIVVEIGPGLGVLTRKISRQAGLVLAIEVDQKLLPILNETLVDKKNVQIINKDALKVDFKRLIAEHTNGLELSLNPGFKVVANLPYYITTPLLMHVLENNFKPNTMVVMVQDEVARRMVSGPGKKDYGALSVAIQFYTIPELVCKVSRHVFIPKPEVGSAVVKLTLRDSPPVPVDDPNTFFKIVRASFGQRRKTLLNALAGSNLGLSKKSWEMVIKGANINPGVRGETLGLQEFAALTVCYKKVAI